MVILSPDLDEGFGPPGGQGGGAAVRAPVHCRDQFNKVHLKNRSSTPVLGPRLSPCVSRMLEERATWAEGGHSSQVGGPWPFLGTPQLCPLYLPTVAIPSQPKPSAAWTPFPVSLQQRVMGKASNLICRPGPEWLWVALEDPLAVLLATILPWEVPGETEM